MHAGGRSETGIFGGFYSDGFAGSRYLEENSGWKESASVCIWDNRQERLDAIQKIADNYILLGDELWVSCGEPYFLVHESGESVSVSIEFAKDGKDPAKMMGQELWSVRDVPLLDGYIKAHPSLINKSPLVRATEVLLPDVFRLGADASDKVRKDATSFLSQPFRHILFRSCQPGQSWSPLGDCVRENLYPLIKERVENRKDAMYHVTEEDADDAFCILLNRLAAK